MKILRLSTVIENIEAAYKALFQHIPEIETYYLFPGTIDRGPKNLNEYDIIWCNTDTRFTQNFPYVYERLEREYVGRLINFNCVHHHTQSSQLNAWKTAGFPIPKFTQYGWGDLPDLTTVPFDPPYMIKADREYTVMSYATLVCSLPEIIQWGHWQKYPFLLQEYCEYCSDDGYYYCGEINFVGNTYIPHLVRWTNHWYTSPTERGRPHLGLEIGRFDRLPGWKEIPDFYKQIERIINAARVDIGALDFSIHKNKVVPWGIFIPAFLFTEGKEVRKLNLPFPSVETQLVPTLGYVNSILKYLGLGEKYEITASSLFRLLESRNLHF